MRGVTFATAIVLTVSAYAGAPVQSDEPPAVIELKLVPLPTFEAADLGSERLDFGKAELASQELPWRILEVSNSGMYLVEFKSQRRWVLDSTVKVNFAATGTAFMPEAMNFPDKDLAGSRAYGD